MENEINLNNHLHEMYGNRFCSCGNKLRYEERSNARGYGIYGYCDKCKDKEYVIEEFDLTN